MEPDFWLQRWQENLIGFHQNRVNAYLQRFLPQLGLANNSKVLVPLCGKSVDMLWLTEQHYRVAGIELSPRAVEDFFLEHQLYPDRNEQDGLGVCETAAITLYCGDFFALQPSLLGQIDAVYDRAALIALPTDMRARYVNHLNSLCAAGTQMLLVTMAYDQSAMNGPPFSVEAAEVHTLFDNQWQVELLFEDDILASETKFRERGLSRLGECVYLLQKRQELVRE